MDNDFQAKVNALTEGFYDHEADLDPAVHAAIAPHIAGLAESVSQISQTSARLTANMRLVNILLGNTRVQVSEESMEELEEALGNQGNTRAFPNWNFRLKISEGDIPAATQPPPPPREGQVMADPRMAISPEMYRRCLLYVSRGSADRHLRVVPGHVDERSVGYYAEFVRTAERLRAVNVPRFARGQFVIADDVERGDVE